MGALIRSMDWSKTLGPIDAWPQSLRTVVGVCMSSAFPMTIAWGPSHAMIYNDGYKIICGAKHPRATGMDFTECWASAWPTIGEPFARALAGEPVYLENQRMFLDRNDYLEETFFAFSFSPIRDESGGVGGVLNPCVETTGNVLSERRARALRDVTASLADAETMGDVFQRAAETLGAHERDVPFALFYVRDEEARVMRLAASVGIAAGSAATPEVIALREGSPYRVDEVVRTGRAVRVDGLRQIFGALVCGPYPEPPDLAMVLPITPPGHAAPAAVLVAGASSRLPLDELYQSFQELLAASVTSGVANARAWEEERRRADALAEIDRAKTAFFSNISHEFRTPLTLMLAPAEDALASPEGVLAGEDLRAVHRNTLRLLKLVNSLLDFSRMEAGRVHASYEPIDLAALTRDLASAFRSVIESGGVRFEVDCPPLPEPVYVDRDMWEKIVLNLLSNAFKFTFEGNITVTLRAVGDHVELRVADTGTGIPPHELPRVFERFHRIEGARARTHEGTGIGLALVHDRVALHGGRVEVASAVGSGATFTVFVPLGKGHLPAERIGAPRMMTSTAVGTETFVQEASRWLPDAPEDTAAPARSPSDACVLVADDNADMRDYVARLLREHWTVQTAADGAHALALAQLSPPDLILADVMMPNLDGFGLLRALRDDPRTAHIPVIMVSARAGEESRVEGLAAGADDYLVKPFSGRELVARARVHLENVRLRRAVEAERDGLAKANREANSARALAEAANRTKDEFLAMLGHELRNPLAPIVTATELMRMRGNNERELQVIERQVGHLSRLIDDLLDISRITRGKIELRKERLELATIVSRGVELASPLLLQRDQTVDLQVPSEGLPVEGDGDRLAQVVSNLLTNASKYSDRGTRIHVIGERTGEIVTLRVRDHGIGIAPQMLDSIFGMFVQEPQALDRAKSGLGLGLSIVRSLVTLHRGTVSATSDGVGKGSEFVVELPLALSADEVVPAVSGRRARVTERPAAAGEKNRVLVVDDNQDAAGSIAEFLVAEGYEVKVAHDGTSALSIAGTFKPRICLLDIGLPVMDGYELAGRLREIADMPRDVRFIAITGYGADADRRRAKDAGFESHLVKPVTLDLLRTAIASSRTTDDLDATGSSAASEAREGGY